MSCPKPLKDRYTNALTACNALTAIRKHLKPGEDGPIRFYECRCGGWHLTSKPLDEFFTDGVVHYNKEMNWK